MHDPGNIGSLLVARALQQDHGNAYEPPTSAAHSPHSGPKPTSGTERTRNPLRPASFAEVIGQERAVKMMTRVVEAAKRRDEPLDHVLLVGASGTGKSTFSHVIANELGVDVYEVEAPVSLDTLLELREAMSDRDMLRIEEVHQQSLGDRRGRAANTQPEVLYELMEDRTITTGVGILPFPSITIVGTTTDEGMLPDAFINRFPIRPVLEPYSLTDIALMGVWNAERLRVGITNPAAIAFARASRGVPRQINNYVRNGALLVGDDGIIADRTVEEVLTDLNGVTPDGLTRDMQGMLKFLYLHGKHVKRDGEVVYKSSISSIATAIGKSRDSKAIVLRVEPYLIEQGYVQVGHGGRSLTQPGVERARELLEA